MAATVESNALEAAVHAFSAALEAEAETFGRLKPEEAAELGRHGADTAIASLRWSQVVGERLNTTQVAQLLGITRQALAKRQTNGSLLGLPGKGTTWYPAWQFDIESNSIRSEVRELIAAFRCHLDNVDPYTVASWASTPQKEDLDGHTPIQWLQSDRDSDQLITAAHRAASWLSQ